MRILTSIAAALVSAVAAAKAQTVAYVTTLGNDTVAFERAEWHGDKLTGTFVRTLPRMRIATFTLSYRPNGLVGALDLSTHDVVEGPNARPAVTLNVQFRNDSVFSVMTTGGTKTDSLRYVGGAVPIPYVLNCWSLMEVLTRHAVKTRPDSLRFAWYNLGSSPLQPAAARWRDDSLVVDFSPTVLMLRVDKSGRLLGADGRRTTIKVVATRLADLDITALTNRFSERERATGYARTLSPRDTVRATVRGADLMIDYGRPLRRGRQVWGALLPYGEVWRTGADAATQFSTSKPLRFDNGPTIPAGMYTLWSIPTKSGVKLIVNKQVGQWGTQYDSTHDVARFDVITERIPSPGLEQMLLAIDVQGQRGAIRMEWDNLRFKAPFSIE
jgi:DUF2911 family protein